MLEFPLLSGFFLCGALLDYAQDVGFLHDHEVLAIELDLGAPTIFRTARGRRS